MRFKDFTWPQAPDSYLDELNRTALYQKEEDGSTTFYGLGPVCRTVTGAGAFTGTDAYTNFQKLQALLSDGTPGVLSNAYFPEVYAYFTGLTLKQEPRFNYVAYEFTFRESDLQGNIPDRSGGLTEVSDAGVGTGYAVPAYGGVIVNP